MNPFKTSGFDTTISKAVRIQADTIELGNEVARVGGRILAKLILGKSKVGKGNHPKLVIEKDSYIEADVLEVHDVVVVGRLDCKQLIVAGELAIHKGADVRCEVIKYNRLVIQTGARLTGHLNHINGPIDVITAENSTTKESVQPALTDADYQRGIIKEI